MPRGTSLSVNERTKILNLRLKGETIRSIALKTNRNKCTINNFLKNPEEYGRTKRSGRPPKLTDREKRQIKRLAVNKKISPSQIRQKLTLPVSTRRIQQLLSADKNLKYQKRLAEPRLLPRHKSARLTFAEKYKFWDTEWQSVIFSDEKKFNLDGPDGCQKYWRDVRRDRETRYARNFQGGSLMVWGAFGYRGKSPICFVTHKMDSKLYCELLDNVLIDFAEDLWDSDWIFQQDNAAIHVSRETKLFLSTKNINTLEWPAVSPDLNPIENLWGILSKRVYASGRQYETLSQLKTAIQEEWRKIDISLLQTLVNSMSRRLIEVINKKGGKTNY